jgi:hypothetical protein
MRRNAAAICETGTVVTGIIWSRPRANLVSTASISARSSCGCSIASFARSIA